MCNCVVHLNAVNRHEYADALAANDFWFAVDAAGAETGRSAVASGAQPEDTLPEGLWVIGDAEELAEGFIAEWINTDLAELLAAVGVPLEAAEGDRDDDGLNYWITVGGARYDVFGGYVEGNGWDEALAATCVALNTELAKAGTRYRIVSIGGGNELSAIATTPECFQVLANGPTDARPDWYRLFQ